MGSGQQVNGDHDRVRLERHGHDTRAATDESRDGPGLTPGRREHPQLGFLDVLLGCSPVRTEANTASPDQVNAPPNSPLTEHVSHARCLGGDRPEGTLEDGAVVSQRRDQKDGAAHVRRECEALHTGAR